MAGRKIRGEENRRSSSHGWQTLSILGFTISGGKIVGIDVLADPERLR